MLKLNSETPKQTLINLYNHFRKEKKEVSENLEKFLEKNEMKMYRETLKETKYKKIWEEYKYFVERHVECQQYLTRIIYLLKKKNGSN